MDIYCCCCERNGEKKKTKKRMVNGPDGDSRMDLNKSFILDLAIVCMYGFVCVFFFPSSIISLVVVVVVAYCYIR